MLALCTACEPKAPPEPAWRWMLGDALERSAGHVIGAEFPDTVHVFFRGQPSVSAATLAENLPTRIAGRPVVPIMRSGIWRRSQQSIFHYIIVTGGRGWRECTVTVRHGIAMPPETPVYVVDASWTQSTYRWSRSRWRLHEESQGW